jgi:hypothetical protein
MPFVFGRETSRPYGALGDAARELMGSAEVLDQAVGRNVLFDARVSEERAEHFFEFMKRPRTGPDLAYALEQYVKTWIESARPEETYLSPGNVGNILDGKAGFQLSHVLNVSSLLRRIRHSDTLSETVRAEFDAAPGIVDRYLAAPGVITTELRDLVARLLPIGATLNGNRPLWGAKWTQFRRHLERTAPDTWNAAVGVYRDRPTVQLVLRYSARGIRLVRPTVLDIGRYAYHFPSPPSLDKAHGGFAMALRSYENRRHPGLVSEYIHAPRVFQVKEWERAGGWCGNHLPGKPGGGLESVAVSLFAHQHCDELERSAMCRGDAAAREWMGRVRGRE